MFIQSFLGFHRNCQSSTPAGKKPEVVSYKATRIDLQDLMHDCDQHRELGYPIYTCAFETSPTKLKDSLERPYLAFLAKTRLPHPSTCLGVSGVSLPIRTQAPGELGLCLIPAPRGNAQHNKCSINICCLFHLISPHYLKLPDI